MMPFGQKTIQTTCPLGVQDIKSAKPAGDGFHTWVEVAKLLDQEDLLPACHTACQNGPDLLSHCLACGKENQVAASKQFLCFMIFVKIISYNLFRT